MADTGRSAAFSIVATGAGADRAVIFTGAASADLPTVALFGTGDPITPIRGLKARPLIALKVRDSG